MSYFVSRLAMNCFVIRRLSQTSDFDEETYTALPTVLAGLEFSS